jgi:hypothetical protein
MIAHGMLSALLLAVAFVMPAFGISASGLKMAIVRGRAKTTSGSKYLQQLCKHWSHKFEVEFSENRGQVRFPSAVATMEARARPESIQVPLPAARCADRPHHPGDNHANPTRSIR